MMMMMMMISGTRMAQDSQNSACPHDTSVKPALGAKKHTRSSRQRLMQLPPLMIPTTLNLAEVVIAGNLGNKVHGKNIHGKKVHEWKKVHGIMVHWEKTSIRKNGPFDKIGNMVHVT